MNRLLFLSKYYTACALRLVFSFLAGGGECLVCGAVTSYLCVCDACQKKYFAVKSLDSGMCRFCGKELISEDDVCMECRENVVLKHLDGTFPLFSYRLWNTSLLCRWKLEGERSFSSFFAKLMSERLIQLGKREGDFVIVPVPPRPGKIRSEGWDQVDELVSFLECLYCFKVRKLLVRHTNVEQKTLDRSQRMEMIGKAYSLNAKVVEVPEKVCLIDDVLTTGSTIETCAEVLKNAGCKKVFAVTLFSVDR